MRPIVLPGDSLQKSLKRTIILRDLKPRELKRFAKICEVREYDSGEYVVKQDSIGHDLHILLDGQVDITISGNLSAKEGLVSRAEAEARAEIESLEVTVNTIQNGDVLGEAAIFMDLPRTASAIAKGSCVIAAVPRDRLFAYCDRNPKAGLRIFTVIIYSLLRRLGSTSRSLAAERASIVTSEELERLRASFPKSLEDMLEG